MTRHAVRIGTGLQWRSRKDTDASEATLGEDAAVNASDPRESGNTSRGGAADDKIRSSTRRGAGAGIESETASTHASWNRTRSVTVTSCCAGSPAVHGGEDVTPPVGRSENGSRFVVQIPFIEQVSIGWLGQCEVFIRPLFWRQFS